MIDKPAKCPKCSGSMEEGAPWVGSFGWVSTPWKTSWLKHFARGVGAKQVRGLRCTGCGYLELYTKP